LNPVPPCCRGILYSEAVRSDHPINLSFQEDRVPSATLTPDPNVRASVTCADTGIGIIKDKVASDVTRMGEMENAYKILVGKPEG
jgi:hypothetical protein